MQLYTYDKAFTECSQIVCITASIVTTPSLIVHMTTFPEYQYLLIL